VLGATLSGPRPRESGRFVGGDNPPCPNPAHREATILSIGSRTRTDGTKVHRFKCILPATEALVAPAPKPGRKAKQAPVIDLTQLSTVLVDGATHTFSVCPTDEPPPKFAPVRCEQHLGSKVIRKGTNNKDRTRRQRYLCTPIAPGKPHTFTQPLPRTAVERDPQWSKSESVKNPHRGPTASGRGQTSTTDLVAEGLQMISSGNSYAAVGRWAALKRPTRSTDPAKIAARLARVNASRLKRGKPTLTKVSNSGANYWQTGADWVEMFSPVLWNAWQEELSKEPPSQLPRVLVLDDLPFFGGPVPSGRKQSKMAFSVLVATEYYPASLTSSNYRNRARLIRAYPSHDADAYELLVLESGVVPDVIVSDSAHGILRLVRRLQVKNPSLVWVPSAFHIAKQIDGHLAKMRWGTERFVPGDLASRVENYSFLSSKKEWEKWWRDFDARCASQGVPRAVYPERWRRDYYDLIVAGLDYAASHPEVPRGTGAVEATIRAHVKPFFEPRAAVFSNIERINRAADLLTLRINGQMDSRDKIATLLRRDAEAHRGFVPPAKSITERKGERLLRDERVVASSLTAMRKAAKRAK